MDYGSRRLYTVADSRQPMYCTYSTRPAEGFLPPGPGSISYGGPTYGPQSRMLQCTSDPFIANQRLMVLPPRIRRVYAGLDYDDDEEDPEDAYVSPSLNRPASKRVEHYIDEICNSPQMEEIESETRKIRRDAAAVLQRLGESSKKKPTRLSSVYFPDLAYTSTSSSSSYTPRTNYSSLRTSTERAVTPEVDSFYVRTRKPTYGTSSTYGNYSRLNYGPQDPIAKVQSEINRKAIYSQDCRKINDSVRGAPKKIFKKTYQPAADEVKNNINFRAQYASMRAAANVGVRKNNDYLMV